MLAGNAAKSAREQLTLIRIFEELRGRGYDGGNDAVRRHARRWSKERGQSTAAAYVPLSFVPGEAYQFDWSHEVVLLNGMTVFVKVVHIRLCHSRMPFVRCYPRETQEMVFDAHDRALVVGLHEGHDDADRNYRPTRMPLGRHPDLAGIYNIGVAAAGVARTLKEMIRAHDVVFIGHGLTSDTRSLLMEGTTDAVITQNQLNTMMSCVGIFNNLRGRQSRHARH
jgi:hypothetical protein